MNRIRTFSTLYLLFISTISVANNGTWTTVNQAQRSLVEQQKSGMYYRVDDVKLRQQLSRAIHEGRSKVNSQIELPVQNGSIQKFTIEESPIMAAGLAAKYPDTKTYKVRGIDDPHSSGRLSISSKGFHGMITGPSGTYYIDPQSDGLYRAYRNTNQTPSEPFNCGVKGHTHDTPLGITASRPANRTVGSLRIYRLAVAATFEYVLAVGGSANAHDEIIIAINRVNQIYQRDLSVELKLVDNNDDLLENNGLLDIPFSNDNLPLMLGENQQNIDAVIGVNNYDIGHVFGTAGGGLALVGSVCTNSKAGGATGLKDPTGEGFYIEYVAHEIGHQFSAQHTFNGTDENCGSDNRWQATAFEPGSGSTIMSYADICDAENIANNADAVFHAGSIDQVDSFTTSGAGSSCGSQGALTNSSEPSASANEDKNFTIPRQTPFILTATAADSDGDPLTYSWDQMDAGTATSATTFGFDLGNNSLFRSYLPQNYVDQADNVRHFPALGTTLQNKYDDSEVLACKTRNLNFRLTVMDGESGIGRDNIVISVDNSSGPFVITSHTGTQSISPGTVLVNWSVANTNIAPVNCSEVDISLLTFNSDKSSYSETVLVSGTANDASEQLIIPDIFSQIARFKIQCSDNIFYDISDADLTVTGSVTATTSGQVVFYNPSAFLTQSSIPSEACAVDDDVPDDTSSSSGGDSGSFGIYWLMSLLSIAIFRKKLIS